MSAKKQNWNLQVILDRGIIANRDAIEVALKVIDGGAPCIQIRDKISSDVAFFEEVKRLRRVTEKSGCTFIINDRVDIAIVGGADGVHLGQEDMPYEDAKRLLGEDKIIGISVHNIEQALAAQARGADYIGVGPIFPTQTKPILKAIGLDIVTKIAKEINIPAVFIGGINLENINEIIKKGGKAIAVASAILNSDDMVKTTKSFVNVLRESDIMVER